MIVHRNHYLGRERRSKGFSFHPTEFSATAAARSDAPKGTLEVEQDSMDVHLNKQEFSIYCANTPAILIISRTNAVNAVIVTSAKKGK